MKFTELITHESLRLPVDYNEDTNSFRSIVKYRLEKYAEILKSVDDLPLFEIDIVEKNRIISSGLIRAIDAYYEGLPSKAYNILTRFMKESELDLFLNKDLIIPPSSNFFRVRVHDENYPLKREELFHVPFELRGGVNTQRFSVHGLPSLYLSNSIYVAWEELRRPSANSIHAVRLSNVRELKILDLSNNIFSFVRQINDAQQITYRLLVWPLIAACSVKVKNRNDSFKPEYIIPQLLLQWVNRNQVDGIKYSSTHINLAEMKHQGEFYNIVIPVKTHDLDYGYCNELKKIFHSTEVIPFQVRQFASNTDKWYDQGSLGAKVNNEIDSIELIKGVNQPYHQTMFGIMEHSLAPLACKEIKTHNI